MNMHAPPQYSAYPSWAPLDDQCTECHPLRTSPGSPKTSSLRSEIVRCTDKCFVVACDKPDHLAEDGFEDIFAQCTNGECEQVCDIVHEGIQWPCAEPDCAMNEMLQCCLNEIPSSLHTQACTDSHDQNWSWMDGPLEHVERSHATFDETPTIRCMWGSCTRRFSNQMDLLSHLQTEHLHPFAPPSHDFHQHQHAPLPPPANSNAFNYDTRRDQSTMASYYSDDPATKALHCLWNDCGADIPVQNQCTGCYHPHPHPHSEESGFADFLLNHLLKSHFGLSSPSLELQEKSHCSFVPETPSDLGTTAEFTSLSSSSTTETRSPKEGATLLCEWKDCAECFASSDDLNTHISEAHIGHGKSSYECLWKGCDRHGTNAFPSKQKVMRHMQKHSGFKPHVCTVCQERFAETTSLQQHMRRHTQEKPYVCDFPGCGKAFSIPGGLRIHKRAHSGEKPFKCTEPGCGRAFSESSNLAKHMRIHSGLKPFHCLHPGCGRHFGRKDQLLRHSALHRTFEHQHADDSATTEG